MRRYDFDWIDAFTDQLFAGNPCAVIHDAGHIPIHQRLALVRETRLSECAFVVPSARADFGARYYLAGREILFAGHPTVATVTALAARGLVDLSSGPVEINLEVGAGVMPVRIEGDPHAPKITMERPAPTFVRACDPGEVAAIYSLAPEDVVGMPWIVSTGAGHCITRLRSRAAVDRALLDVPRLLDWQAGLELENAADIEPFLCVTEGADTSGDTYARLLLPPPNPPEDPMTGSATTEMGAYLWATGALAAPRFIAHQGHGMGRPSAAEVELLGPPDAISGIRLSGRGVRLMEGVLTLP